METQRIWKLKNQEGKSLTIRLRPYREGDEGGMIACIRDEYGSTYFKQKLYEAEAIKKEQAKGTMTFLIAETLEKEIVGMMLLKQFYPEESMCEIASQIFQKKYRGYGLAMPFFEYGMELLVSRSYSAALCLPVLFHDTTQRLLYRLGLRATGMILNVFDVDCITHSYNNGRNRKHSQGIQVKALEKQNVGILYLPEEHKNFCIKIYNCLGVRFQIAEQTDFTEKQEKDLPLRSNISYVNDNLQHSLEIKIHRVGTDLCSRLEMLHSRYPLNGKQTVGVSLNCNEPGAFYAYNLLTEMGYFFTGLKPLCSKREYIVMHHSGEIPIFFEDYRVSEEFAEILAYIRSCYEGRHMIGEGCHEKKNNWL